MPTETKPSRRAFLKTLALGSLSTVSALTGSPKGSSLRKVQKRGDMYYRRLGRTGLFISEISLGGSPLPDWSLSLEIVERGVNYIDTSCTYSNGNSERQIGRLFKEVGRDKVYVSTKFHLRGNWSEASIIQSVEASLRRLQTDTIDVLAIHGASREEELTDERLLAAFDRLKKQGKFRFTGLSCHFNHRRVITRAVECGRYDVVQLGYNVFEIDSQEKQIETYADYLEESGIRQLINLATSKDVGVIAMKTLKVGGRRQNLDAYRAGTTSLFQGMLKWVLENKKVAAVVTEIMTRKEMEEDLGVVGSTLRPEERRALYQYVARNNQDYCRMCGRCQESCPSRLPTTDILRFLSYHESYGKKDRAGAAYRKLPPSRTALACQGCGVCEAVCRFGVSVRKRLREAHAVLAG